MPKVALVLFIINLFAQAFPFLFAEETPKTPSLEVGQFVINLVAVIAASLALWKYINNGRKTLKKVEDALPVLFEISKEFNPKEGGGLRQTIDAIRIDISSVRAKTHLLLEQSATPIFLMDERGRVKFVNSAWIAVSGVPYEQALGNGWTTAIHDDDKQRVFSEFRQIVLDNRPLYIEFRFVNETLRKIFSVRARAQSIEEEFRTDGVKAKKVVGYVGQLKVLETQNILD